MVHNRRVGKQSRLTYGGDTGLATSHAEIITRRNLALGSCFLNFWIAAALGHVWFIKRYFWKTTWYFGN
jgi:hypothetical protein